MKSGLFSACTIASIACSQVSASALPRLLPNIEQFPNGYAPGEFACPNPPPAVRSAASLSDEEKAWLQVRQEKTTESMRKFLSRINIPSFDADSYVTKHQSDRSALPNLALAISGGGHRAMLTGAGVMAAFDERTPGSTDPGHLGGLLQSTTYLTGVSAGSWLVGSVAVNDFRSVSDLTKDAPGSALWQFGESILHGPRGKGVSYFTEIAGDVLSKEKSPLRFNTTITDYWGRAISYQLLDDPRGGPGVTWSSIAGGNNFKNGEAPFPIILANGRSPGTTVIPTNATVYEFNPFEFGSFDRTTFGFTPVRYIGSQFTSGKLVDNAKCVQGFDNAGYIIGTSSSIFNKMVIAANLQSFPDIIKPAVSRISDRLGELDKIIADFTPNPFYKWNPETNDAAESKSLTLVDGAEDLQVIPFHPVTLPERGVDVIFAMDAAANDEHNWPNGASLVATYNRSLTDIGRGHKFPAVPDVDTIVRLGLNKRPAFFGCGEKDISTPLVVYIPNAPYSFQSNISALVLEYSNKVRDSFIQNGYDMATRGNGTVDGQWSVCVACAAVSRSLERTKTEAPSACKECFQRYCWDGASR